MNVDILKQCNTGYVGYIGYYFLKHVFCSKYYQGINLNVFYALYPNLERVQLFELSSIDSNFLDHIYKFLSNNKD